MSAPSVIEIRVEKHLNTGPNHCVLGTDREGDRVKFVIYPPATVVLYHQLEEGKVYRFYPAPVKSAKSNAPSYSSPPPSVTSSADDGFPAYPAPIGPGELSTSQEDTFQDLRVTVEFDFGCREYDTKRGKVQGRQILCTGHGDQKFDLVLWAEKAGDVAFKKGATVVFYDVWIRKNVSDQRPAGRMELSGSLSMFGSYTVDTLQEELGRAFVEASPAKKTQDL